MQRPLLLVTADWHLRKDGKIWLHREKPSGDVFCSIAQIKAYCEKYHPRYLVLAGDILDNPKNYSSCVSHLYDLATWPVEKIYYVQGQHDFSDPPWLSFLGKKAVHLNPEVREELVPGISITGVDYNTDPIELLKRCNADIVVTHQVWDLLPNSTLNFNVIPDGVKLLISGDYHNNYVSSLLRDDGELVVLIPGAIAPNAIDEEWPFYTVLVDDNLSVEFLPLKTRKIIRREIDSLEDYDKFIQKYPITSLIDPSLPEVIRKPILQIRCSELDLVEKIRYIYEKETYLFIVPKIERVETVFSETEEPVDFNESFHKVLTAKLLYKYPEYTDAINFFAQKLNQQIDTATYTELISILLEKDSC